MCLTGGNSGAQAQAQQAAALQMLALQQAARARADSQAAIAQGNLDTESSRAAADTQLRKAALSQGFMSTVLGGGAANDNSNASVGYKMLFGQ